MPTLPNITSFHLVKASAITQLEQITFLQLCAYMDLITANQIVIEQLCSNTCFVYLHLHEFVSLMVYFITFFI